MSELCESNTNWSLVMASMVNQSLGEGGLQHYRTSTCELVWRTDVCLVGREATPHLVQRPSVRPSVGQKTHQTL